MRTKIKSNAAQRTAAAKVTAAARKAVAETAETRVATAKALEEQAAKDMATRNEARGLIIDAGVSAGKADKLVWYYATRALTGLAASQPEYKPAYTDVKRRFVTGVIAGNLDATLGDAARLELAAVIVKARGIKGNDGKPVQGAPETKLYQATVRSWDRALERHGIAKPVVKSTGTAKNNRKPRPGSTAKGKGKTATPATSNVTPLRAAAQSEPTRDNLIRFMREEAAAMAAILNNAKRAQAKGKGAAKLNDLINIVQDLNANLAQLEAE